MHGPGRASFPWLCLREVSDTQAPADTERLCRHDLLNQQTAEGRKEMRLINWARKQVSDMSDVGSKSIIDVLLAKSGAAFDSSSRARLTTLIDTGPL